MKYVVILIVVCFWDFGATIAQDDPSKEIDQAITDYKAGKYAEALPIFEKYRAVLENDLKDRPDNLKVFYEYLATCYQKTGKQKEYEALLPLFQAKEGSWKTLNKAGKQAYQVGDYQKAIEIFEKAKTQAAKEFGKEHPSYASSLNNLAFLYQTTGRYAEAEPLYQADMKITAKLIPAGEHPSYALSLNNLAALYRTTGRYAEAEPLYKAAMKIRVKLSPAGEHPSYASSLNNLALLYETTGRYAEAEPLYQAAMKIFAKLSPAGEHPDYASSLNNLAALYQTTGRYAEAEPLYQAAMKIRAKLSPAGEHPSYASSLNNLALLYETTGRYAEAEAMYQAAMKIFAKLSPVEEHPSYALSLNNLAALYRTTGRYAEAEPLYQAAMRIRAKLIPAGEHPSYASSLNNLAGLYQTTDRYAEAEPLYQAAMKITAKLSPTEEHPDYASSLNNLAAFYETTGRYAEAEPLYQAAMKIRAKLIPVGEHPSYALSLNNLAVLYETTGRYVDAEPLHIEAKNIQEHVLGKDHPDYAVSCNNLAALYEAQGDYTKAVSLYQKASEILIGQTESNFVNLSEKEKQLFFKTFQYNFEIYNSFTLKAHRQIPLLTGWLYDNTLVTKGLLLQSTQKIRASILNSGDESLKKKFDDWQAKRNFLAQVYNMPIVDRAKKGIDTEQLEKEANELEKELSLKSQAFAEATDKTRYSWQDVQQKLQAGEAALEIIRTRYYDKNWTDSVLYIALIVKPETHNQPEMIVLPNGNELEGRYLSYYLNHIKGSDRLSYTQYWQPIAKQLRGIRKVYLSADGVYQQINLNALQNPKNGKYLLEEIEIHQLGSTKDLVKKRRVSTTPQSESVLMGRPKYNLNAQAAPRR